VKITLSAPDPDLESAFARYDVGAMVSPKALQNSSGLAQAPDGTGPYVLNKAQTVTNDHYTFTRKSSYWAGFKEFPYKTIVDKIIPDSTSLLNAAITGQVDVDTSDYPTGGDNALVPQAQRGGLRVLRTPPNAINVVGLLDRVGMLVPAMKDVRVRQALNYAIDRKAVLGPYFHGYGEPISNILPPTARGYDKAMDNYYAYNPTKAKALLKAAGYPHGFSFTLLTIPQGATAAEVIAGFLKKVGVTLNIHTSTNFAEFYTQKYPSIPGSIDVPSAYTMVQQYWQPSAFLNPFHGNDPTILALANRAAAAKGSAQTKIMKQIDDRATKDSWFITLGGGEAFLFYSKKLAGVQVTKRGNIYLYGWHPA
jgi:peptide/nickel transport system substrate-binding protein